jgi:hypothetical protein
VPIEVEIEMNQISKAAKVCEKIGEGFFIQVFINELDVKADDLVTVTVMKCSNGDKVRKLIQAGKYHEESSPY